MVKTEELLLIKGMERSPFRTGISAVRISVVDIFSSIRRRLSDELENINALTHLGIMKGSVVSISMIHAFFYKSASSYFSPG